MTDDEFGRYLDDFVRAFEGKLSYRALDELEILLDRVWLKLQSLPSRKRKGAVSIIEHPILGIFKGQSIKGIPRGVLPDGLHPVLKSWLDETLKFMERGLIKRNWQHGKCAEVDALSKLLWKIDPSGKLGINEIREQVKGSISRAIELSSKSELHGSFKKACDSCNPMLDFFKIIEDETLNNF